MTSLPAPQGKAGGPSGDLYTLTRVGQVFLDARRRQLFCLDPVSRQLYKEGIPFTPGDLHKRPLRTLAGAPVGPNDLPLIIAWREGRPVEGAFALPREHGPEWRVSWNAAPARNADGEFLGVVGTIRCGPPEPDWQAMAGLAHDLRTPLNAVTLQVAVLHHLAAANPELARVLEGIQSSAERALRVGKDLLNWCRGPGYRGRDVELSWFPLEPLLTDLALEQTIPAHSKGLVLATDFSASRGWEVRTDRGRLARILSNLLVNAIRYTPRGKVEFTAAWQEEARGRTLAIGVVDTGVGITPEEQESIFQPFERGRAGKQVDSGGSGLGLSVVDRLVEELGVELEVYSEHGRGSAFHLHLPLSMLRSKANADAAQEPGGANRSRC
jgi:hypothetical protein